MYLELVPDFQEKTETESDRLPHREAFLQTHNRVSVRETPNGEREDYSFGQSDILELKREDHLLLGFDTEYQTLQEFFKTGEVRSGLGKYEVLSYQFFAINYTGGEWSGIAVPDQRQRMSFTDFIIYAISKGVALGEKIPKTIILVGHYTRADVPAFDDSKQIFPRLKNVRNSLVSVSAPIKVRVFFGEGETKSTDINVYVKDTMHLAPTGSKSLAALGELINVPKQRLSEDDELERLFKQNMAVVRTDDWNAFKEYAIADAEIAARYYKRISDQVTSLTGKFAPTALSSVGMDLLIDEWAKRSPSIDPIAMSGREEIIEQIYDEKRHYFRKHKHRPFIQKLHWHIDFATECYHGGRNEQLWFGPSFEDAWTDFDLSGAYPTAMATIGNPKWDELRVVRSLEEISSDELGLVCVDFKFPDATRYPSLPVRSQNGIIFPLSGRTCCAMPEIELARQLGCIFTFQHGVAIPQNVDDKIFFPFIKQSIKNRNDAVPTIEKAFWKEATNSCYGKTAQGLRDKRVFNLVKKGSDRIAPSAITNPFIAAQITSFVRAVIGEIMNAIPANKMVFSVTTDGFITNANEEEMSEAKKGPLAQMYADARRELVGVDDTLSEKHDVRQVLGWRTRGQATIKPGVGKNKIVLARAGIKPPIYSTEMSEQNDYILESFFDRTPESEIEFQVFTSVRETILWDADLVKKKLPRRISMEFDFKRRPHAAAMISGDVPSLNQVFDHVCFSTRPWKDIAEFNKVRRFWNDHWATNPRCIKALGDFRDFALMYDMMSALEPQDAAYLKRGSTPDLFRLQRDLCRAFKHSQAGLDAYQTMTAAEFGRVLNESGLQSAGVVTSRATVENGKRTAFKPHCTQRSAAVLGIIKSLLDQLPLLDPEVLLARGAPDDEISAAVSEPCHFIERVRQARSDQETFCDSEEMSAASVSLY